MSLETGRVQTHVIRFRNRRAGLAVAEAVAVVVVVDTPGRLAVEAEAVGAPEGSP